MGRRCGTTRLKSNWALLLHSDSMLPCLDAASSSALVLIVANRVQPDMDTLQRRDCCPLHLRRLIWTPAHPVWMKLHLENTTCTPSASALSLSKFCASTPCYTGRGTNICSYHFIEMWHGVHFVNVNYSTVHYLKSFVQDII